MRVTSKIETAALLLGNTEVAPHIPRIQSFTRFNLESMLQTYPTLYIKPDNSAQGKGIFRVDARPNGTYMLRSRDIDDTWIHNNIGQLWTHVNHLRRKRFYILQQGISSETRSRNLFDIRVHMARINGNWIVAGMIGRVAPNDGIVTNYFLEGPSTYVFNLLTGRLHYSDDEAEEMIKQLEALSLNATTITSAAFPRWSEFGLDIGIDADKKLWIYEINITPGATVFLKLNQESFERILNFRRLAR